MLEAHVAGHRAEAKAEGEAEGRATGLQDGLERGRVETLTNAVLAVLAVRGIAVNDAERARILGEQDPAQLDRWLAGAATCAEAAELFTTRHSG